MNATPRTITAYKGFNSNWTCCGHQFEVGKTYEHDGPVEACKSGFHACTHPLDVFGYYPPAGSRFALVEVSGYTAAHDHDSKIAAARITIRAEIQLVDMIEAAVKAVLSGAKLVAGAITNGRAEHASATGYGGAASATGYSGAASAAGYRGAASATGYSGAASATGASGAASATGYKGAASATGKHSVAMAAGQESRAQAALGCALFLVERNADSEITAVFAGVAGRAGIKPMTWYSLIDGKPTEV